MAMIHNRRIRFPFLKNEDLMNGSVGLFLIKICFLWAFFSTKAVFFCQFFSAPPPSAALSGVIAGPIWRPVLSGPADSLNRL
jgi:hypothetical protein